MFKIRLSHWSDVRSNSPDLDVYLVSSSQTNGHGTSTSCLDRANEKALDRMLGSGDEAITYRKAELKTFVALGVEDKLADDELSLLGSVLEFSEKEVSAIMVSAVYRS